MHISHMSALIPFGWRAVSVNGLSGSPSSFLLSLSVCVSLLAAFLLLSSFFLFLLSTPFFSQLLCLLLRLLVSSPHFPRLILPTPVLSLSPTPSPYSCSLSLSLSLCLSLSLSVCVRIRCTCTRTRVRACVLLWFCVVCGLVCSVK